MNLKLMQRMMWAVTVVLLALNLGRLRQLRANDPLLGLWDTSSSGPFKDSERVPENQLLNLVLSTDLHFTASEAPVKRARLIEVLEDYGLEESHLRDVIRKNNLPPAPQVTTQPLEIPFNNLQP
jgi:hypothetical protein